MSVRLSVCLCQHPEKPVALGSSQDFHISRRQQQQQQQLASNLLASSSTIQLAHHPHAKQMDPITRPVASSFHRSAAKHLHRAVTSAQRNGVSRRCLLTLLTSTAAIPGGNESRKALLQEYLKKSEDNKEKNDKERLDDYYKRNYKDYFGLIEGPAREKKEEERTESEKRILEWLDKNK